MVSKTSDIIKQKLIQPALQTHLTGTYGVIVDYHYATSTATVEYSLPGSSEPITTGNIPMRQSFGSLIEGSPKEGDQCMISFQNGDPLFPFISCVFNENYPEKVMERQIRESAGKEYSLMLMNWDNIPVAERESSVYIKEEDIVAF